MSDNWVVQNLENALEVWNDKLSEIWQLITQSPETFKGGDIWSIVCSIHGALQAAVLLYFVLKPYVGTETVSWMCILGAAPFAAMGFVNYNGMTAEQFVWAWLRSEMLEPKQIKFEPVNIYYEALKDAIDEHEKEAYKRND